MWFYVPLNDGADWGANAAHSPVMGGNYWFFLLEHSGEAERLPPISVLLLATSIWSDGTPAGMKM